jgi:hypothetical protein
MWFFVLLICLATTASRPVHYEITENLVDFHDHGMHPEKILFASGHIVGSRDRYHRSVVECCSVIVHHNSFSPDTTHVDNKAHMESLGLATSASAYLFLFVCDM